MEHDSLRRVLEGLRDELAGTGARVRVGFPRPLRPFLRKGVAALTLGRRIFLAPPLTAAEPERIAATLRHELVHVRQTLRLGLPRFLLRYLAEYLRFRLCGLDHDRAYRAISFEREAFAAERPVVADDDRSLV